MVTTVEAALRFLADVGADNFNVHLDIFHMNIDEPSSAAAVRRAGDLLVNMHVSDSNRKAPARGHTDFDALMRALYDIDYQGALTLEPIPPGSDPGLATKMSQNLPLRDIYAEEGIRYLKQIELAVAGSR